MDIHNPNYIHLLTDLFSCLEHASDDQLDCIYYIVNNVFNKYESKFEKNYNLKNHEEAIEYFKKNFLIASNLLSELSDNGCAEASYYLGLCYDWAIYVDNDAEKAFHYYLLAANSDFHKAYISVAVCYQLGLGVDSDIHKSIYWFKKASDINNSSAQYSLYLIYSNGGKPYGDSNLEADRKLAYDYLLKAGNNGHEYAQAQLASIEEDKRNYKQSFHWFNKSALNGHDFAQFKLGYYFENGIGCEKNVDKAIFWYTKSADQGFGEAQNALHKLGR